MNLSNFTVCRSPSACIFSFPRLKDTVAKKREHNEEDREGHALVDSALRFDAIVHHHVPVLTGQDLAHRHRISRNETLVPSKHMQPFVELMLLFFFFFTNDI